MRPILGRSETAWLQEQSRGRVIRGMNPKGPKDPIIRYLGFGIVVM